MILSIASIFICPLGAIPGLVLGIVELGRIRRGVSPKQGYGFALAGAIVGGVVTAGVILFTIWLIFIAFAIFLGA